MEELVSIITPSYNTADFIGKTIESVQAQTYHNWEMIIVDDCSTDDTDSVIRQYLIDERIHYIKNDKNSGAAISRNKALRNAKGRWIAFLDSDDVWHPQKLEYQLRFMKKHGYAFSYTDYIEIDEHGNLMDIHVSGPEKITHWGMNLYCWPGCLTVMYDRNVVGDIQIGDIRKNNDYAMWLAASKRADCYRYPRVTAKYRKRDGSISSHGYLSLVKWHYRLWREAEKKNIIVSLFFTGCNLIFGVWKKIRYVKKRYKGYGQK